MANPRDAVIAGVGQTDFGKLFAQRGVHNDAITLGAEALALAVADAGLELAGIDGLITSRIPYEQAAQVYGIWNPRVINGLEGSGRMSGVAIQYAAAMIEAGQAEVIACVYGNDGRSAQMSYGGEPGYTPTGTYNQLHGMTSAGASVAMMYQRYRHEFGIPDGALAALAINNRRNAALNPGAVMRKPIDHSEYIASRYVAEPLRLLDYCVIADGGAAIIVTTLERARDLRKRPVRIAATAGKAEISNHYWSRDFFSATSQAVAQRVYERSGTRAADIDILQIYDNFTPITVFSLEGFGHAPRGEGTAWASLDRIGLKGETPLNTAGGHTGEAYMQGWGHHVEAVRQIRGEAGERQVARAEIAQYICVSPIVSSHILVGE